MRRGLAWFFLWAGAVFGCCRGDAPSAARSRQLFLEAEGLARATPAARQPQIRRVYEDSYPAARMSRAHLRPYLIPDGAGMTPEQLADRIEREAGWGWLSEVARAKLRQLLLDHREMILPLASADLKAAQEQQLERGLRAIGERGLVRLLDSRDPAIRWQAEYALAEAQP